MDNCLPEGLLYNNNYSWVKLKGDVAEIGITHALAESVKEFVFVELPKAREVIKRGQVYVSLESVKWSGHLVSPVTGEIIGVNEPLFDTPSLLNKAPYKEWIIRVKLSDRNELKGLMDAKTANANLGCKLR